MPYRRRAASRNRWINIKINMKLFSTSSIEIVKHCQEYFDLENPSVLWAKRVNIFENKVKNTDNKIRSIKICGNLLLVLLTYCHESVYLLLWLLCLFCICTGCFKKVAPPPKSFWNIFSTVKYFCMKFVGSSYNFSMSTHHFHPVKFWVRLFTQKMKMQFFLEMTSFFFIACLSVW